MNKREEKMRIQKLILQDIAYKEIICADEELMKNKESYDLETASIYCRMENAEFFGNEESGIKIHKGGKVSLDTYSNSFSVGKWAKYTVIDTISLFLDMEGSATVKLMHAQKEGNDIKVNEIKSFDVNNETRQRSVFDFGKLADEGIYYAEIEAKDSEVTIYGGSYDTVDMEPTQTVKLAIDICTFKREKYVKRNMGIIFHDILENEDSPLYRNLWIHISDNASSLDGIVDSNEFITVSKNANLGGVGGFTRGIIETKKRQKEMGFTHVLLMDDDATISSAAIELNYILLSYLKPEYFGHTIGGKLLVLNVPYLQFEAGAQWNKGKIKALKNDLDIRQLDMVLESEIEDKPIEYTGWWYCCIPLSEIDDNNLPLPIFIHRDDIEYGLRVGRGRFILINGICIWHEAFAGKMPGMLDYYDIRNEAIINAIQCPDYTKEDFKKAVKRAIWVNISRYRYKYIEYNYRAAEDFCKGIDWLLETDSEKLHKELIGMNYKAKKIEDYIGYKGLTEEELVSGEQGDYKLPFISRLLHKITLNGYFFPVKKDKVTVNAPYGSVYKLFRIGEYIVTDNYQNAIYISRDRKEFFRGRKVMKQAMKLIDEKYDAAAKSYRERYKELVSEDFWKKYLGID